MTTAQRTRPMRRRRSSRLGEEAPGPQLRDRELEAAAPAWVTVFSRCPLRQVVPVAVCSPHWAPNLTPASASISSCSNRSAAPRTSSRPSAQRSGSRRRSRSCWDKATVPPGANCPSTPDSCAVACQLSRQQTPADGAPQGAETRALTCCRGRAARKRRAEPAPRCPRGGQAGEASGGDGSPGRKPIYQGLHHVVSPTTELPHQVGKNSLRGSGSGGPAVLMSLHPVPPVGAAVVASVIAQSYVA